MKKYNKQLEIDVRAKAGRFETAAILQQTTTRKKNWVFL